MSLYHIEENLLHIFAEIEENEGEISEELFAELNLTKENLKDKLTNYVHAIRSWEAEATNIKDEVKKLSSNANIKLNRVERLKKAMLTAIQMFGDTGKSGNKVIDLPMYKLFTKNSQSTQTDEERITKLVSEFERFVREIVGNGILYTGSDVELQGILDVINANLKAEHDSWNNTEGINGVIDLGIFIPYTLSDLTTMKIKITTTQSIYELFRTGKDALVMYGNNPIISTMNDSTPKDDWKTAIGIADVMNDNDDITKELYSYPTVAKIVKNTSIQIK